ncbi:MAG: family 20 glycosylhydrolase [Bacteroidales bacterium]|jgi:hypothetical protein|nr:family 20 glycosylhydrolase [Bacteroidales bacterium]
MRYFLLAIILMTSCLTKAQEQSMLDEKLPVRGLAIAAPSPSGLELFLKFIETELAPAQFNLLILRVDFNYAYETHPELRDPVTLSKADVKRIVNICSKYNIQIAPQVNLLGHQSWAGQIGNLLKVYPEFDETPHVKMPEKYEWPNPDGLYCKSYCPLHPDVHKIVFELVDELLDAFETNLFHAGMDEVFYIGDDKCPRCSGRDKAELFAGEVTRIHQHLQQRNGRLYIWGDRLIDGKTTGIGMWEGSMNQTHRAIDMIPKDVFICDWHYERADLTPVYFAMKGFDVATCPWRKPQLATVQLNDMLRFRQQSVKETARHFRGMIQTVWSGADSFLKSYYDKETYKKEESDATCLKQLIAEFKNLNQ